MEITKEVKSIWKYLEPYKKTVVFILSLTLISALANSFIPLIYGQLVDLAIQIDSDLVNIVGLLALWLLISLTSDWFDRIADDNSYHLAHRASHDFTLEIGGHLLDIPMSFHSEKRMGEQLNKLGRGAGSLWNLIHEVSLRLLPQILTLIVVLVLMFVLSWQISLMFLLVLLVYSAATLIKVKQILPLARKFNKQDDKAYGQIWDATLNVHVVKSNVNEDYERRRYKHVFNKLYKSASHLMPYWRSMSAWQKSTSTIGFILVFGAAIFALRAGELTAGGIVSFIGFFNLAMRPVGQIGHYYRMFKRQMTRVQLANDLLDVKPEKYNTDGLIVDVEKGAGDLEIKDVWFKYDKEWVLEDISLKVKPGQVVALVGESGVGKSTFISLISRYIEPNKGQVLLDGKDIKRYALRSLRDLIAVVPQEVTLFNDTVINNIKYGKPGATQNEILSAAEAANATEFIDKLSKKYVTLVGERGVKLSVGQKQRIAIARAILRDPEILILDEATSALDSKTEKLVQEALERLIKGRTTFVIAHRLSTIRHADLILVFGKGRIKERGTHQELMQINGGIYKSLYSLQHTFVS